MVACPPPRCAYTFKNSYLVGVSGTVFNNVVDDSDCSTSWILLTDDPGLQDVDDASLGNYLDVDNRIRTLTSFDEVERHFKPWSETWQAARSFFGLDNVPGSRSGQMQVGFIDRADGGETLLQAWQEITKCPVCSWVVSVVHYNTDGDPYVDTVELRDLQASIRTDKEYDIKVPTIQASIIFNDPFETVSEKAIAAQQGSDAHYVVLSYYCDVERDSDGNVVLTNGETTPKFRYSYDAVIAAAIATSWSQFGTDYNWTLQNKPISFRTASTATGLFLDETTNEPMTVTEEQAMNATGINGFIAGSPNFVPGATGSVSGFFRFSRGITFLESLRVNRQQFADVWYKEKAFRERLENSVVNFKAGKAALGLSQKEAIELAALIQSQVISPFIANNVINTVDFDWEEAGYSNILISGGGFVITLRPLSEITQSTISQRNGYTLGVCVIINEPNHRVAINLCEIPVTSGEV